MILKMFLSKHLAKILAFLPKHLANILAFIVQAIAICCKNFIITLAFEKNDNFC
jgi:hypothetical protein